MKASKTVFMFLDFASGKYIPYSNMKAICRDHPGVKYRTLLRHFNDSGQYTVGGVIIKREEVRS